MENTKVLFESIGKGNAADVRRLLEQEPSLAEGRNENGVSAVLFAAYCGRVDCIELLRSRRANLDLFEATAVGDDSGVETALKETPVTAYSSDGFTPLHLAAFFGHVAIAERLIRAGANVNAESKNPACLAPLNSAAACRNLPAALSLARLLLANGADPNHPQTGGYSPLHSAAANGNRDLVAALIAAGANVPLSAADGRTAASLAKERGHEDLLSMLS